MLAGVAAFTSGRGSLAFLRRSRGSASIGTTGARALAGSADSANAARVAGATGGGALTACTTLAMTGEATAPSTVSSLQLRAPTRSIPKIAATLALNHQARRLRSA